MHPAVRPAGETDVEALHDLILQLADHQRAAGRVVATPADLRAALFGPEPAAYALVVEVDGRVAGLALWFRVYSTWEGVPGIYLEDLYVRPEHRGLGLGKALLAALAEVAVERGWRRLDWSVLDWNAPSIAFYVGLGAVPLAEQTTYRLTGDALTALAAGSADDAGHGPDGPWPVS